MPGEKTLGTALAPGHRREQVSSTVALSPLLWGNQVMLMRFLRVNSGIEPPFPPRGTAGGGPAMLGTTEPSQTESCSVFLPSTFCNYSRTFTNTKLSSGNNRNANRTITLATATCLLFPMDPAIF